MTAYSLRATASAYLEHVELDGIKPDVMGALVEAIQNALRGKP